MAAYESLFSTISIIGVLCKRSLILEPVICPDVKWRNLRCWSGEWNVGVLR